MSFTDFQDNANGGDGMSGGDAPDRATDPGSADAPGVPLAGHPGWRVGAFGSGNGVLGLIKISNPGSAPGAPGQGASPPRGYSPVEGGGYYMQDAEGRYQLQPTYARKLPKGPFDFGAMAHNIDWGGVVGDLAKIGAGVASSVLFEVPEWYDLLQTGAETLDAQNEANRRSNQGSKSGAVDRATDGRP